MIVGTAGHIDHGKTTLLRALTGVDTDRLPEEKRRGMSIELGYAYLRTPDGASIGFVDVPGHERLLHTMLAGATGIDHALLLVAADDGVMPQTLEHLAVLSLLGVPRGTVAITKIDRVDAARLDEVRAEVLALLDGTGLDEAPVIAVSASSGEGLARLREHLIAESGRTLQREPSQAFRLAIDRRFTLDGVGTVATGTVHAGRVQIGDELRLVPGERSVRVRSVHAQNEAAEAAVAGQRCALGLAGVAKDEVARGQWLCAPAITLATQRLDAEVRLWSGELQALRSGVTVHVHLGASDVMASLAWLDRESLAPGGCGLAQLVLREPVAAWHGDRGVLRDASATRTLAGLRVLDPRAPARYRRTPARLALLQAWALPDPVARLAALLAASPAGLDRRAASVALAVDEASRELPWPAEAVRIDDRSAPALIAPAHWQALQGELRTALAKLHDAQPDDVGPDARRLKRLAAPRADEAVFRDAVDALLHSGAIARSGAWLHLPEHAARLGEAEQRIAQKLLPLMLEGGFDPPWVRDLARPGATPEAVVRLTLAGLARRGLVFQVVKDLYYPLATIERLAALVRAQTLQPPGLNAASFRDATGLGRKRAIQLLEFFDRIGFTRRVKDAHVLRPDTSMFETTRDTA